MRTLLFAALVAAAAVYAHKNGMYGLPPRGGPLDGTVWEVKVKPDSFFSLSHRDTLIFDRGLLTVAGAVSEGFSGASYSAESAGARKDALWNAMLDGAGQGVENWHGATRGDRIEGSVDWRRPDGTIKRLSFRGRRKGA